MGSTSAPTGPSRDQSIIDIFNTLPSPNPADTSDNFFHAEILQTLLHGKIDGLRTKPFSYQRRSAALMFQREQGIKYREDEVASGAGSNGTGAGAGVYDSRIGGILAEEMGSGKTLICLMLILASKFLKAEMPGHVERREIEEEDGEDGGIPSLLTLSIRTIMTQAVPWQDRNVDYHERLGKLIKEQQARHKWDSYEVTRATSSRLARRDVVDVYLSNATIVVVPGNLTVQWEREILKHLLPVEESGVEFKYRIVPERGPIPSLEELLELDLLLISRARFDKEIRDGEDNFGRRRHSGVQRSCDCSFRDAKSNERVCKCPKDDGFYSSPLLSIHWKRIIVDEGHSMASAMTNSVLVADMLRVDAKWAVTGTPSSGLYTKNSNAEDDTRIQVSEKTDLKKIGQIVTKFLKLPPYDNKRVQWPSKVEDALSSGILRSVLERVMIRHQISDIEKEAALPPLHERVVKIKPGFYEKLTLNLFLAQMATNEVTSERTDQDWFFHSSQRKSLNDFVNNMRESAFYWTALNKRSVVNMRNLAGRYLDEEKVKEEADKELLRKVIRVAETALGSEIWKMYSVYHEMGYCIQNLPEKVTKEWSLDQSVSFGTDAAIIGSAQLMAMQNFVSKRAYSGGDMTTSLAAEGEKVMPGYRFISEEMDLAIAMKDAGEITEQKYEMVSRKYNRRSVKIAHTKHKKGDTPKKKASQNKLAQLKTPPKPMSEAKSNGILKISGKESEDLYLTKESSLGDVMVTGVASAKLAYLISKVLEYKDEEKILIFYETDQVAWYIAEALSLVGVPHLLYARTGVNLHRKAEYLVTFNTTDKFRVFLLDVSQAAQGIHLGCASRVFFVNPIWQPPSILAQAIKRAHRIGQTKPVYVETLILEGTIEETIFQRKNQMNENDFRGKKLMVDDDGLRNLLTKEPFLDIDQNLELNNNVGIHPLFEKPQRLFGEGKVGDLPEHPDLDIVKLERGESENGYQSPKVSRDATPVIQQETLEVQQQQQQPKKRKRVGFIVPDDEDEGSSNNDMQYERPSTPPLPPPPRVRFADDEDEDVVMKSEMPRDEDVESEVENVTRKMSLFDGGDRLSEDSSAINVDDGLQQKRVRDYGDEGDEALLKRVRFIDAEV